MSESCIRLRLRRAVLVCATGLAYSAALGQQVLSPPQAEVTPTVTPAANTAPSAAAQKFTFTKVDLEFLRQIDAFDKYIEEKGWIYDDPATTEYVERVGRSVVPSEAFENVKWRFRVLRDPVPNAFALPNGSIYIHSGLLSRLQNEAQLAGVLAHEVTHAFNRHGYLAYHDMRKKAVAIHVLSAAATAAGVAGVNAGVVNAIGTLLPMLVVETMFGYRRELEHESDVYAVGMLKNAGYDPLQVPAALDLLTKGPEVDLSVQSVFWSDHPKLKDRVRDTTAIAHQLVLPETRGKLGEETYLASTSNVIRHDAGLALLLGRPRTALAIANRLLSLDSKNPDDYVLLGDAYRTLGARAPEPTSEEQTDQGKKNTRKMLSKMTTNEFEKALLANPGGKERWETNLGESERAYLRALEVDANNRAAHRGLGYLRENQNRWSDAIASFSKYLELAPDASDAKFIRRRVETLQKKIETGPKSTVPGGGRQ